MTRLMSAKKRGLALERLVLLDPPHPFFARLSMPWQALAATQ